MRKILAILIVLAVLAFPLLSFAGTLTGSAVALQIANSNDGYFLVYQVTLTQIDADPSNDTYTIGTEAFSILKGGIISFVGVASANADNDVGSTISTLHGTTSFEWFDEEFTVGSLPYSISAHTTLGLLPPITGTSLTIGTDTDWTDAASGDSITVYLWVLLEEK